MSLWSRIANVLRGRRLVREIDEELESHIEEAIESGRDPAEARRAFGPMLATRDASRDIRLVAWLDSLRADVDFGVRQLLKSKTTSAAAILSLGLAFGACTAAFRLVDAVLLRPLPIENPEHLYLLEKRGLRMSGAPMTGRTYDYPSFRRLREEAKPDAELIAVSFSRSVDLTYGSDYEIEKAYRQYVSGWMFDVFGLRPELGRLLGADDDRVPQGHPYAVLSHDYWRSRFGSDPNVIGTTFLLDKRLYEIVGVVEPGFTGVLPGTMTDIFIPTMMHPSVERSRGTWLQILVDIEDEAAIEAALARMQVPFALSLEERAQDFRARGLSDAQLQSLLSQRLSLQSASAGAAPMQGTFRQPLAVLSMLAALVLIVACANIANLMSARAAARAREMALRVAIGAERQRLVQLVLIESGLIAAAAGTVGAAIAWRAAPAIVGMIDLPSGPARLALPVDWRLLGFGLGLLFAVTAVFGLTPALRASWVRPTEALRGGDDPPRRRRPMVGLIGAQVAFCFVVVFAAGLLGSTFERLANQPTGYSAERLLALETVAVQPRPPSDWEQVGEHLRSLPGIEAVALAGWPLMSGQLMGVPVSIGGGALSEQPVYVLGVAPGWIDAMRIPLLGGRDLRREEANPSVALANVAFAREYFNGEDPVGETFEQPAGREGLRRIEIVGLVGNAKYDNMREPMKPTIYVPWRSMEAAGGLRPINRASFLVRTSSANPLSLAGALRRAVPQARSELYVSNLTTQQALNDSQLVRERLLAMLALFFAAVALVLSAVGIYGVLHYSVVQRRREIGICIALGARGARVAWQVTATTLAAVLAGSAVGVAGGVALERSIESLLWGVTGTDPQMLAVPALTILATLLAVGPAVSRAVRIDPAELLRTD